MLKIEPGETSTSCLDRNKIPALIDWDDEMSFIFQEYTILSTKATIKLYRLAYRNRIIRGSALWDYLK